MAFATVEQRRAYYRSPKARASANAYARRMRKNESPAQRLKRLNKQAIERAKMKASGYSVSKEKRIEYWNRHYSNPINREKHKARKRAYYKTEKYKSIWRNLPRESNLRVKKILRGRLRNALMGKMKSASAFSLLGCSIEELRTHIQSQFKPGMAWNNWCKDGWHIDHIKPCNSFDLTDPLQQKECFHFTNLQPLWWHENLSKSYKTL
jgi:hypothetical protein